MTQHRDTKGDANSLITTPMSVSNVGTEQGGDVAPERIECIQSCGGLLTHTEGTGLTGEASCTSARMGRQRLLNEVGEHD